MHNALNHIVAQRRKRPNEANVKISAKIVDEMLADTSKLVDEMNAEKEKVRKLEAKLAEK